MATLEGTGLTVAQIREARQMLDAAHVMADQVRHDLAVSGTAVWYQDRSGILTPLPPRWAPVIEALGDIPVPLSSLELHRITEPTTLRDGWSVSFLRDFFPTSEQRQWLADANRRLQARMDVEMQRWIEEPLSRLSVWRPGRVSRPYAPTAYPSSGLGLYGDKDDSAIPDTPLDEWNAGVEKLLAECEAWEQRTDAVLDAEPVREPWVELPTMVAPMRAGHWRHQTYPPGVEPAVDVPHDPAHLVWCETAWPRCECRCGMYRLVWE